MQYIIAPGLDGHAWHTQLAEIGMRKCGHTEPFPGRTQEPKFDDTSLGSIEVHWRGPFPSVARPPIKNDEQKQKQKRATLSTSSGESIPSSLRRGAWGMPAVGPRGGGNVAKGSSKSDRSMGVVT